MADATHKPVIFLAFANDRDDTIGYLRNLPDEARRLREVLGQAVQAGLCEVEVRSNCTAGDIFKVFQDPRYRNRIAIFHYGGHANGFQLLLESAEGQSASADAGGLAAFLAQQQGLQLVFLNGCSTQLQTQGLLDANISVVLSTSRAIDDKVATDFSSQFYQGLASGATIHTAYHEAAASLQTAHGNNMRGLYFGVNDSTQTQQEADRWPWNLYLREGSESADQWNLPEAVNDPLFGLPPLPKQDLPESPYRHLNWFTRKDAEVFFGRGHQIRELYDRLTAPHTAPIILFYGQSGVGKSSVLDAGLIPRLEQAYEVRYLRRAAGGLLDTLQRAFLPEADDVPIETAWRVKEERIHKPLIVFLDQVEELYTRPIADVTNELEQLLKVVKATFCDPQRRPQGKLVLSFRKEWLAELETQLVAYELPRTKIFLATLDRRGIIEVVRGPARSARLHERYGLTVEDGLAEIIADDLLEDRDSAIAPTLQILLTKMWAKATEANYEHPQFNQELYQHLKRDGILLRDFLNQQIAAFRERHPEAVDSGLLLDVVALHTTRLGTADQCSVEKLQQQYAHLGATLPAILQHCQDLHLLTVAVSAQKESVKTTRLAHDTLAPLVREQFDQSDKPGQRARRILDNRAIDWVGDLPGMPLDEADLKLVEHGVFGTRVWNSVELRLVEASRKMQSKLQRTRQLLKALGAVSVVTILLLGAFGWWNYQEVGNKNKSLSIKTDEAKEKSKEAVENALKATRQTANAFWQVAITARNQSQNIKAGFNFLIAAQASDKAGQQIERRNVELAAQSATSSLVCALPNDIGIVGISVSNDGTRLLARGVDGGINLWNVTNAELLHAWKHEDFVSGAKFASDGNRVFSWSHDGAVKLWDVTKADPLQVWTHNSVVAGVEFTRDETRFLSWSANGTVKLCDVTKAKPIQEWTHQSAVQGGVFSNDDTRVLTWAGSLLTLCDVAKPDPIQVWKHKNTVLGAKFANDGTRVLSWNDGGAVTCWDVTKPDALQVWTQESYIVGAAFTRDGNRVLTWNGDGAVMLRDVTNADYIRVWKHEAVIKGAAFSHDETRVLSWSKEGAVKLWDVTKPEPIQVWNHQDEVNGATFSSNETRVLSWSQDHEVKLWDVTKSDPIKVWGHQRAVNGAVFSRDETRVLSWSEFDVVKLWDVTKTEPIQVYHHESRIWGAMFDLQDVRVITWTNDLISLWDRTQTDPIQVWQHDGFVGGAVFTRDERRVLAWSFDGAVKLWDVTKADPIQVWNHGDFVTSAVFTRDEAHVLSWSGRAVKLWSVAEADPIQVWLHQYAIRGATLTRDETRVLSWCCGGEVKLWDVAKSNPIQVWNHVGSVAGAVFTRDEKRVLTWGQDNTIVLWDVSKADPIQVWYHDSYVVGAKFSPEENLLLAWSGSGAVKLWDVTKTEPLQIWKPPGGSVKCAAFTRDGTQVLSWDYFGKATLWDIAKADPVLVWNRYKIGKDGRVARGETRVLAWSPSAPQSFWNLTEADSREMWPDVNDERGVTFNTDGTRVVAWSGSGTARLWDVTKADPLQVWDYGINGACFTPDEHRLLAWGGDGTIRLWDMTKADPLHMWSHQGSVRGAVFTRNGDRFLAWNSEGAIMLWNAAQKDVSLTPTERILELEVRSASRLDSSGRVVNLKSDEWIDLIRSPEYGVIREKKAGEIVVR